MIGLGDLRVGWKHWRPYIINPNGLFYLLYGRWWSVVFYSGRALSLGIHIEYWRRERGTAFGGPRFYGPYVDLHIFWFCVSVGNWPIYAGNLHANANWARGGLE